LDTSHVGQMSGQINVSTSSDQVPNPSFSQGVSYAVLDHADASLSATSDVKKVTFDFGTLQKGDAASHGFAIFNLPSTFGANLTAGLDLLSVTESGDPQGKYFTDLTPFAGLIPDGSNPFTISLDTTTGGTFSAEFLLNLSDDQSLAGATSQTLEIDL